MKSLSLYKNLSAVVFIMVSTVMSICSCKENDPVQLAGTYQVLMEKCNGKETSYMFDSLPPIFSFSGNDEGELTIRERGNSAVNLTYEVSDSIIEIFPDLASCYKFKIRPPNVKHGEKNTLLISKDCECYFFLRKISTD